jgi:hypothetical protein
VEFRRKEMTLTLKVLPQFRLEMCRIRRRHNVILLRVSSESSP